MRIYIPFVFMVTFNMIVLSRLHKSKHNVHASVHVAQQRNFSTKQSQIFNKEFRFKMTTIIIDFIFLVFYTPMAVNLTFGIVDMINASISTDPLSNVTINTLFSSIATCLTFAYSVAMSFMFFIFNHVFRREFFNMLYLNQLFTNSPRSNQSSRQI